MSRPRAPSWIALDEPTPDQQFGAVKISKIVLRVAVVMLVLVVLFAAVVADGGAGQRKASDENLMDLEDGKGTR